MNDHELHNIHRTSSSHNILVKAKLMSELRVSPLQAEKHYTEELLKSKADMAEHCKCHNVQYSSP